MTRISRLTWAATAFSLIAAAWSAYQNDWTTDEPAHLEWSRRLLDTGLTERRSALHFNSKTPVTLLNEGARRVARRTLGVRDPRIARFATRLPGLVWLAVVLAATFVLARHCAGPLAAHLATLAVALDPNLIANSSIATVDTAYAAATLLTVAAAVGFAERPTLAWGAALGLAVGLAFAVKFTAFLLVPGLVLVPLAAPGGPGAFWRARRAVVLGALVSVTVATAVICAAYLFTQIGVPLGTVAWKSRPLAALARGLPGLALPLPVDFLTGLDICLSSERNKAFNVVILGGLHPAGVWYYFAFLWLLKTPLLLLLSLTYGFGRALRDGLLRTSPALGYVALHLCLGLVYFSFVFRMQIGYRFVLMCVPLAAIVAAAGLVQRAAHPAASAILAVVVLTALAENAGYLGNSLAFTNAALWPKRQVFRLVADSNVDYGQNDEKMEARFRDHRGPMSRLDPVHILPGENVLGFNLASGAAVFPRHQWLREHLDPTRHFRHTYLFFDVSEAAFEQFLDEARRLGPAAVAADLCPPGDARAAPADPASWASFSSGLVRGEVELVCVSAASTVDLALRNRAGEIVWGRADAPRRDWERLREGQEAWYRLEPGVHALVAAEAKEFQGAWVVRGGPATLAVRREKANKKGLLPPEPAESTEAAPPEGARP